ncbi:hypothetical protein [Methyloprofundus sp.]|uniref:hypothetical protein n=1 Tax=Methyloprofundus sp. TaxID=2020875 RepID=UPI003D0A0918
MSATKFNSLDKALQNAKANPFHRFIFLHGDRLFELLSSQDTAALSEAFDAGAPVGTSAMSKHLLAEALGLGELHDHVPGDSDRNGSIYFMQGRIVPANLLSPERRVIDHLEVVLDVEQPYPTILGQVIDWHEKNLASNESEKSLQTVTVDETKRSARAATLDPSSG